MLYYLGKGAELKKEDCKEYKTLDGAKRAWEKAVNAGDAEVSVWDENGTLIVGMTDDVPEGALQTNPDGSVNAYDADGNKVGTVDAATVAAVTGNTETSDGQQNNEGDAGASSEGENGDKQENVSHEQENGQNEANTQPQQGTTAGVERKEQNDIVESGDGDDKQQEDVSESDTAIVPQGKMKVTVICDGTLNLRRSPNWGNGNVCGRASRGQSYYVKEIHTVDGKKIVRTIDDLYLSGASEHVQFEQL
ncbi:MAG: hypothetical protein KH828_01620 [Clostridiales bacterium]|nr:hypothetical protein [Clostridiales bacterium]